MSSISLQYFAKGIETFMPHFVSEGEVQLHFKLFSSLLDPNTLASSFIFMF